MKDKHKYYLENKEKWRKGGKYYYYKTIEDRSAKIPIVIKKGKFIISFD